MASGPRKTCKLPTMCPTTKAVRTRPVTATICLAPILDVRNGLSQSRMPCREGVALGVICRFDGAVVDIGGCRTRKEGGGRLLPLHLREPQAAGRVFELRGSVRYLIPSTFCVCKLNRQRGCPRQ